MISTGLIIFVLSVGQVETASAEVTVHTLFSDHAVLQQGIPVPVWGTASPGEELTVEFNNQSHWAMADDSGNWMIHLDSMDASSESHTMVITGDNNVINRAGIQIGEVWIGSGQSNMQRPLSDDLGAAQAIADAASHNMRFFNVTANGGNVSNTVWEISNETSAPAMSAVHFYFGRHLAEELPDVPIGLITSAVSATAIERWATCAGSGKLYNGQIVPLQPYAIKGATWYQGEWDARGEQDASKYYWQLPCLIEEWRTDWGQGDFPFYVVQMPKMGISSIQIIRDAELRTALDDPEVEIIVTIDQPGSEVHPPSKEPFGIRLATLARKFAYGEDIVARSPLYNPDASYVAGDTIRVVFDHVADGLQPLDGPLAEWEIADSRGNYVAAEAVVAPADNNTVEVRSPSVPNPVYVRYAFRTNPVGNNLFNSAGLPASPIRELAPGAVEPVCGDLSCDVGEDDCSCPGDCGPPPLAEMACENDVDDDCDGVADCADNDCGLEPVCQCLAKRTSCSADSECCSNKCRGGQCR